MKAYYYKIKHELTEEIVAEGIIRNSEDTIFPQQESGIEEFPYECEAHHFNHYGYKLSGFEFDIPSHVLFRYRLQ